MPSISLLRAFLLVVLASAAAACLSCGAAGGGGDGGIPPFSLYWSVAVADLNGDGLPDIATSFTFFKSATSQPGFVVVYLQDPSKPGTFLSPMTFRVGDHPVSLAIGDLNGDGQPDIAVANTILNSADPTSGVYVLLQDPLHPGQFLAATSYATGTAPSSVTIGDLNGDGKPDLVVADGSGVSLLFQDPNTPGSFLPRMALDVGSVTSSVAIADFNGDGKPDLATTTATSVVVVLQDATKGGTFLNPTSYQAGLQPIWVAGADLNGDGKPDLAVANLGSPSDGSTASLSVLLQNPATPGSFLAATEYKTDFLSSVVVVADLNGDGKPDIAVANTGGLTGVCPPTCNLSGSVSVLLQDPAMAGHFLPVTNYASHDQVLSVAVGDMNGDHKPDLVIANGGGIIIRLQDQAHPGMFLAPIVLPPAVVSGN